MRVIPIRPDAPTPRACDEDAERAVHDELRRLLLGDVEPLPLPPVADILSAALALADGSRVKSLLPLGAAPAELVLLRRASRVLVSYYRIDGPPEVEVLDRPLALRALLDRCADAAERLGQSDSEPTSRELTLRLAERARAATIDVERAAAATVRKSGGAVRAPRAPLAFGFEAALVPVADPPRQTTAHSDAHALLFPGALWMWARGRRIPLVRGPIMIAVQRMVAAVRALVEAWEAGRPANVRLRAGGFVVGVRLERRGARPVQLTLGSEEAGKTIVPELAVEDAALPVLRLASDVLRALVSVDRSQSRNLRVSALREEVRGLRRRVREREPRVDSLVHGDPERLRAASGAPPRARRPARAPRTPSPRTLRFDVRWEAAMEDLDAASTFLCGDRLVVATPRQTVALDRDDARVLWAHEQPASASFMAGTVLVQLASDGRVALCDVADGETFAEARLAPRIGGPPVGLLAGGRSVPPVAILAEGRDRLVAVDLRTGELRWRFRARGSRAFSLRRVGRILLSVCGDGTLCALDVANGELLWRLAVDGARFVHPPAVSGDVVVAASGEGGDADGRLFGVDLFSGRQLWSRTLDDAPASAPIAAADAVAIAVGGPRRASLAAIEPTDGSLRWMVPDPGAALGGSCLALDHLLVVNAPAGHLEGLALEDGRGRWARRLSHPVADDVPRRLEPVLRGGALFVPSAAVHVIRPHDGSSIGEALPCELVPDWMRVDERGWVFVAEESGHLCAMAPRPHLTLVR
ncbi:MAG TPA: PQQ-binding-like beta-propeller repeat protein [Sandaracinaceae bacterium LLY-WYZ-13_1]|nr:PQQ-binding-like beta-propeller repeat protein [Sandaracinaceae bacterium LLY-WYZ-13_1]